MRIDKWIMTIYVRPDSWTGSRLFEVNIWMWHWQYGRHFQRKFSLEEL
jgi:hypothetical protein